MHRTLLNIHLLTAAFLFPIALMFAFTGGLYTLDIKGGYDQTEKTVALEAPLQPDLAGLTALATRTLTALGEPLPSGSASIKKAGTSFEFEWTGVERDIVLRPTADPASAILVIKDTSPWRHLVQLHKAKGGSVAKAISVTWAVGLVVILATGMTMAWTAAPWRRKALRAGLAGLVTFGVYVLLG
jgi:hypothetical protein